MRSLLMLTLLGMGLHVTTARIHSFRYFSTASSQVPNFPEFVQVGLVDDVQISHYDSNTKKVEPKQDWMRDAVDPQYWEEQTAISVRDQQVDKGSIETVRKRFNQTKGVHMYQWMSGCDWDDETGKVIRGYHQFAYDGEDFIALDSDTQTWVATTPQAFITKNKWETHGGVTVQYMNYINHECPDWLKKYVNAGRRSLLRTELPTVSLLQRSPSSPVRCHATGFYPDGAVLFWRKDGEELHEDVDHFQTLPNHDGTFQMSTDLRLSSVAPEDWGRYECVFQLSGVEQDLVTKLHVDAIESNRKKPIDTKSVIIIAAVVVLVLAVLAVGAFLIRRRMKQVSRPPTPVDKTEEQQLKPPSE